MTTTQIHDKKKSMPKFLVIYIFDFASCPKCPLVLTEAHQFFMTFSDLCSDLCCYLAEVHIWSMDIGRLMGAVDRSIAPKNRIEPVYKSNGITARERERKREGKLSMTDLGMESFWCPKTTKPRDTWQGPAGLFSSAPFPYQPKLNCG